MAVLYPHGMAQQIAGNDALLRGENSCRFRTIRAWQACTSFMARVSAQPLGGTGGVKVCAVASCESSANEKQRH